MEVNEVSRNAHGGTEQMLERLHNSFDNEYLDQFQIIPSRVREIDKSKKVIFWAHDLPQDPESAKLSDPEFRNQFDKFVFVSNWQMQMYNLMHGVPYDKSVVINNAIEPIDIDYKEYDGTVNLIYHTTPHRGLALLYPVFQAISERIENVHLDVYSSFGIYGWPERDAEYQPIFDLLKAHPKITYHGWKPNSEIRDALKKAHIFAYPNVWPETSCIAAIEAMSAGCEVVFPNYAALPETMGNTFQPYSFSENPTKHIQAFADTLVQSVLWVQHDQTREALFSRLFANKRLIVDSAFNWAYVQTRWKKLFEELLNEHH